METGLRLLPLHCLHSFFWRGMKRRLRRSLTSNWRDRASPSRRRREKKVFLYFSKKKSNFVLIWEKPQCASCNLGKGRREQCLSLPPSSFQESQGNERERGKVAWRSKKKHSGFPTHLYAKILLRALINISISLAFVCGKKIVLSWDFGGNIL